MHRSIALVLVAGVFLSSSVANAAAAERAEEIDFDTRSFKRVYIGASAVASWTTRIEGEFRGGPVVNFTSVDMGYGLGVTYGVRAERWFSLEMDFEWIEGYDIYQSTVLGPNVDKLEQYSLNLSFGFRPINHRIFDPFLQIGGGWTRVSMKNAHANGDGFAFRFGLGSDFWVTDHIGIRLEGRYLLPATRGLEDLDSVAARAGVFYRF